MKLVKALFPRSFPFHRSLRHFTEQEHLAHLSFPLPSAHVPSGCYLNKANFSFLIGQILHTLAGLRVVFWSGRLKLLLVFLGSCSQWLGGLPPRTPFYSDLKNLLLIRQSVRRIGYRCFSASAKHCVEQRRRTLGDNVCKNGGIHWNTVKKTV